jgi:hypothetical protein
MSSEEAPPKIIIRPPTLADFSPKRKSSVKALVGQWEMNSIASNSDAGSLRSDSRSMQSDKSFSKRFPKKNHQLFNLVLHIPMPDGDVEDYEVEIHREYDPTEIATAVCKKHDLDIDAVGEGLENQINRLVAETCLLHTDSYNEELDRTREIAIDAHAKQKRGMQNVLD